MAKYLRYMGEFLSRAGIAWRVEILQDADAPFDKIGSLTFEADEPLVIEWNHTEKEEVIGGSTATLRIESPGDRTYEDLYTIAPGRIRMDVYRNNLLYWSGALDPEFYEEPYERAANYPVSLTFHDFGILDRLKYNLSGMRTLYEIVADSINRAGFNIMLDESLISTCVMPDGVPMQLADLKVRSDNFFDEDGEALSLKEVLEGVLQPLALRMVQRAGRIYIYDLNALYVEAQTEAVVWDGDSQTMSTDKVCNNAKVTWSTYAQSGDLLPDTCWDQPTDPEVTAANMVDGKEVWNAEKWPYPMTVFSYPYGDNPRIIRNDLTAIGFSLWLSDRAANVEITDSRARFFKIVPQNDGSEAEGMAINWPGLHFALTAFGDVGEYKIHGFYQHIGGSPEVMGTPIFKTESVWIPPTAGGVELHVGMEVLVDPRINFNNSAIDFYYTDATKINPDGTVTPAKYVKSKKNEAAWNSEGNFIYVPVRIIFESDNGERYCWDNRSEIKYNSANPIKSIDWTKGTWVKDNGNVWGYLAYYDPSEDRYKKSGVMGWQKNRPAINPHREKLTVALEKADGQYLHYPMGGLSGGTIHMEVLTGWLAFEERGRDYSDRMLNEDYAPWILCKLPTLDFTVASQYDKEIDTDDVEYSAVINPDAKDGIEIDTICGSSAGGVPTARGAYYSTANGNQVKQLTRAGRTSQVEDLLIGTLFSQFGQRRTKLSGEMQIASGRLCAYTEANQPGKKFMITSDVQDVIADISDAEITELRPDEYERRD